MAMAGAGDCMEGCWGVSCHTDDLLASMAVPVTQFDFGIYTKKNFFLPKYMENRNKYITFAA